MRPLLAVACLARSVKSIIREVRYGGRGRGASMKTMEREVCLEMAPLEENEPLVDNADEAAWRNPHASSHTCSAALGSSAGPEQLRSGEPCVFEALRVTRRRGRLWGCNAR